MGDAAVKRDARRRERAAGAAAYHPSFAFIPLLTSHPGRQERVQHRVEAVGASGTEEAELLLARNEAFEGFRRCPPPGPRPSRRNDAVST